MNYQSSNQDPNSLPSFTLKTNKDDNSISLVSTSNPRKPRRNNYKKKPGPTKYSADPAQQTCLDDSFQFFGNNDHQKWHEEVVYIPVNQSYANNNTPIDQISNLENGHMNSRNQGKKNGYPPNSKPKKPFKENRYHPNQNYHHHHHGTDKSLQQHSWQGHSSRPRRNHQKDFPRQGQKNIENNFHKKRIYNYDNQRKYQENFNQNRPQTTIQRDHPWKDREGKILETREEILREKERIRADKGLTIYYKRDEIMDQVRNNKFTIVVGDTGCGKSTQLPQYLYEHYEEIQGEQILWVLPRKLPTLSLSQRVCEEMKIELGKEVGYEVPGKIKANRKTLLKFVTDSVLINELIQKRSEVGPTGKIRLKYSIIILDEVHERNLYTDILLATLKEIAQETDLKLLITSATINEAVFENYFQTKAIQVKGRPFPVEIDYNPLPFDSDHVFHMSKTICDVVAEMNNPGYPYVGHILLFTAGVDQIIKVRSKLEDLFRERWINRNKYEVLPLHGLLAPDEQQEIFRESNKIKIILSTRMAETALTINGVRIVIDIGYDKETSYNGIKRMTVVEDKPIAQSSAIQRAGRAGRTSPGKCIRLYRQEEFEAFPRNKVSEIQRMNLGKLVLKLKALGIADLKRFEFVEKPNEEVLFQTIEHLMEMRALDGETEALTYIGKAMLKLETDPDFSKVIIEAWRRDCVKEVIEIIAMIGINQRLYKRGYDDDTREAADKKKLGFCHEKGDLLTLLKIYRFWTRMSKPERRSWCDKNFFSFHALNQAYKVTKDLNRGFEIVSKILEDNQEKSMMIIQEDLRKKQEMIDDEILKCFLAAFYPNVCLYTNVPMVGYSLLRDNLTLRVHGGSSLALAQDYPQYIFCIDINKTTFNNSKLVSVIQQDWISEMFPGYGESPRLKFLATTYSFIHFKIPRLSRLLLKEFQFKSIEEIKAMADSTETVFLAEDSQEWLKVYSSLGDQREVERRINKVIEKVKEMHRSQTNELPIVLKTRCIFHQGGEVREILLSHETLSLKYDNFDSYYTAEKLEEMFSMAGEVVNIKAKIDEARKLGSGVVTMKSYKDVNQVLDFYQGSKLTQFGSHERNESPVLEPFYFKLSSFAKRALRLRIEWFVGVSQCDVALKFVDADYAEGVYQRIQEEKPMFEGKTLNIGYFGSYNGRRGGLGGRNTGRLQIRKAKDSKQLVIENLNPDVDEIDVEKFFRGLRLDKGLVRAINFRNLTFDQDGVDEITTQEAVEIIRRELEDSLGIEATQIYRIEPYNPPKPKVKPGEAARDEDMRRRVEVDVFEIEIARKIIQHFDGKSNFWMLTRGRMHCSLSFSRRFGLKESKYRVIEKELENKLEEITDKFGSSVRFVHEKGGGNFFDRFAPAPPNSEKERGIRVIALDPLTLDICCNEITPIVSGVPFYLKTLSQFRKAEVKSTGTDISNIERSFKVSIEYDKIRKVYKVFGAFEERNKAIQRLKDIFDTDQSSSKHTVKISFRYRPVRHILQDNAALLVKIEKDFGVNIKYSLMYKEITVSGLQDRVFKAEAEVTRQVNLHESKDVIAEDECPICLEQFTNGYRLLLCGHKFCFSCLERELAERLASNPVFPIKCAQCVGEGGNEVICLRDLQNILTAGTIQTLWDRSLDVYLRKNPNLYFRCFSPDCPQLFREGPEKCFSCDYCIKDYCKKCRGKAHGDGECNDTLRRDLLKKLKDDGIDVRECPGCHYIIERSAGCNKMQCQRCQTIFCWLCREIFSMEGQVYTHLNQVHDRRIDN